MRRTVLIVDDQPQVRLLLRHILDREGYRVLEAEDEASAVFAVGAFGGVVDLAVIDIELPGPSGRQVAATLRRFGVTDSVFISGLDPAALVADGRLDADDALVRKPFTVAGVMGVVKAAVRRSTQSLHVGGPWAA
jgi:DNA-binding response OmpR family regulator